MEAVGSLSFNEIFSRRLTSLAEKQKWVVKYCVREYVVYSTNELENFFMHCSKKNLEDEISKCVRLLIDDLWFPHGQLNAAFRDGAIKSLKEIFNSTFEEMSFNEQMDVKVPEEFCRELEKRQEDEDSIDHVNYNLGYFSPHKICEEKVFEEFYKAIDDWDAEEQVFDEKNLRSLYIRAYNNVKSSL